MGTKIPEAVRESALSRELAAAGLQRVHQGKVRDTYALPNYPNLLLQVATDRVSIFDFVLPALVPFKGEVLTALTVFWTKKVFRRSEITLHHHIADYGRGIDGYLPRVLKNNSALRCRALVVMKLRMLPIECIMRGHLTGSGWPSYQKTGKVCGITLSAGLHDGDRLPEPIFTPTTKAEEGHDKHISAKETVADYGNAVEFLPMCTFRTAYSYAVGRGIVLADTKFELGLPTNSRVKPRLFIGDEILTPDSSRFWDRKEWEETRVSGKSPASYDKQVVRDWGKLAETPFGVKGIDNLDPAKPEHVEFVHGLTMPEPLIFKTVERYLDIFHRLTGNALLEFQTVEMGK